MEVQDREGFRVYEKHMLHHLLQGCIKRTDLRIGREVHRIIDKAGFGSNSALANHLIRMYAVCGSPGEANQVFSSLSAPDVFAWTALISAYAKHGQVEQALELYHQMQGSALRPDDYVYVAILQACGNTGALAQGRRIHEHVRQSNFKNNVYVGNTLIDMYAKCKSPGDVRKVFDALSARDLISWNSMISGYVKQGLNQDAIQLFEQMQLEGVRPDRSTFLGVLKACSNTAAVTQGKLIHGNLLKRGFGDDVFIGSILIDMYCKSGCLQDAREVFESLATKDLAVWNTMIAGYSQHAHAQVALSLFYEMQNAGLQPDRATYLSTLKACTGQLGQIKLIHTRVMESPFNLDAHVASTLIDMYAKCDSMKDAHEVFDRLPSRDPVTWTALISAYVRSGDLERIFQLFDQMQQEGMHPDKVTLLSILKACCGMAALDQGKAIHAYVVRYGLDKETSLCNSLIDMYSKCGSLGDARAVFDRLEIKDQVSWTVMIAGYSHHGDLQSASQLFSRMQLEGVSPDKIAFVSLLSACSHACLIEEGSAIFRSMIEEFGIVPETMHFACIVDLLGRAGLLQEAEELILQMPLQPDVVVWTSLLGACRTHGNVEVGRRAFESILKMDPRDSGPYILMANIYSAAGQGEAGVEVLMQMQQAGIKKQAGRTWIDCGNKVHSFTATDVTHPDRGHIYDTLDWLDELFSL